METLPVTAIIPTYNRPATTVRAIESILAQRPHPPAEIIVVDDGSSDDTAAAAEATGVKVIRHETNQGLAAARNTAIAAASHDWIALLDSDDEWLPGHLAAWWAAADSHVLVGNCSLYVSDNPPGHRLKGAFGVESVSLRPATLLHPDNLLTPSAAMVRRDAVLAAGGFVAYHDVVEDLALWMDVLERGTGVVTPVIGVIYRVHDEQMSGDRQRMFAGMQAMLAARRDRGWWTPALLARWRGARAWDDFRDAIRRRRLQDAVRAAAIMVRSSQHIVGVATLLTHRREARRASARVTRDGRRLPS